ncbi:DUF4870 domain-containing protein [Nocardioides speluncae]|uniref:DUF4870 domain-containing protein n=1 Tax=Nocardioides speluncae TaxID=2670337 RepID=UPI000D696E03|nr:DUF4870 domain-containing protein [Nocardioides speluncae]
MSDQYPQNPPNPGHQPAGMPPAGAPQPLTANDINMWSAGAHGGALILGFVAPLVVMLTKGNESPAIRRHAVESLNFQITMAIAMTVSIFLIFILIGILTTIALSIGWIVLTVIATIKAYNGEDYRYPVNLRMVS